jgi:hypothetical protein
VKQTLSIAIRGTVLLLVSLAVQGSQGPDLLCADCANLRLQSTQTLSTLPGCYWAGNGGKRALIRVQRMAENVYTLDTDKAAPAPTQTPVTLHTAQIQDIRTVSSGFGIQLEDGITVTEGKFTNSNPIGIYRGHDASGKPVVLAYLLFFNGNLEPARCTQLE